MKSDTATQEHEMTTATVLTKTIAIRDPWGHTHRARVHWMPLPMHGVDAALDNFGRTPVAFGDEDHCPIYWRLSPSTSCAELVKWIERFEGDIEMIAEANRVDSLDELEPGSYYRVVDEA